MRAGATWPASSRRNGSGTPSSRCTTGLCSATPPPIGMRLYRRWGASTGWPRGASRAIHGWGWSACFSRWRNRERSICWRGRVPESATTEAPANLAVFYGGTFDPVHRGHLQVARHARDLLGTVIRLMPAADPPHRAAPGASAQQRAEMLDLAVLGERGLQVDRRELARATPSYSIETLQGIRAELGPAAPVALLIGADGLIGLSSWKNWRGLFD